MRIIVYTNVWHLQSGGLGLANFPRAKSTWPPVLSSPPHVPTVRQLFTAALCLEGELVDIKNKR